MKYNDICAIDAQGRVLIPSKLRKLLSIETGTAMELELSDSEIRMRKCRDTLLDTRHLQNLISVLHHSIKHGVFLCNSRRIITSAGIYLPPETPIPDSLYNSIIQEKESFLDITHPIYMLPNHKEAIAALFPIYTRQNMVLAVLSNAPLTDTEIQCSRITAKTVGIEFCYERR